MKLYHPDLSPDGTVDHAVRDIASRVTHQQQKCLIDAKDLHLHSRTNPVAADTYRAAQASAHLGVRIGQRAAMAKLLRYMGDRSAVDACLDIIRELAPDLLSIPADSPEGN